MFGFFKKKKSEKEKLQEEYQKLMEQSYKLSHTDRAASSKKAGEAEEIMKKIEALEAEEEK